MSKLKSKWTDWLHSRANVLNHSRGLRLERFTSEDLDQIADCDDVLELKLDRSKMKSPWTWRASPTSPACASWSWRG